MSDHLALQAHTTLWGSEIVNDRVFCGAFLRAAVASQYGKIQLLNPVGSNRVVYVMYVNPIPQTLMSIRIGRYDTALGTNLTTVSNTALDGAAPVATLNSDASVTQELAASYFAVTRSIANGAWSGLMPLTHIPFRLTPGMGIMLEGDTVNIAFQGSIYWAEKVYRPS